MDWLPFSISPQSSFVTTTSLSSTAMFGCQKQQKTARYLSPRRGFSHHHRPEKWLPQRFDEKTRKVSQTTTLDCGSEDRWGRTAKRRANGSCH